MQGRRRDHAGFLRRREVEESYEIRRGEAVVLTVERGSENGLPDREWTFTLTPGHRGSWRTHSGPTFVPGWWEERRFLEPAKDSAGRFLVRKADAEISDLQFAPSIFFHFLKLHKRVYCVAVAFSVDIAG